MEAMRELMESWMNIIRPTHWNGQEIRRPLLASSKSGVLYKNTMSSAFQEIATALRVWYSFVAVAFCYITTFLLLLILHLVSDAIQAALGVTLPTLVRRNASVSTFAVVVGLVSVPTLSERVLLLLHAGDFSRSSWTPFHIQFGKHIQTETSVHLFSIIRVLRERTVSEPKDRSYAIHGVLRRLGMQLSPVDYGRSLSQVYQDLFTDLVRWEPRMVSLILDATAGAFSDSPSWVPNWNGPKESLVERKYIIELGTIQPESRGVELRARSGKLFSSLSINGSRLIVATLWNESVQEISNFSFHPMHLDEFLSDPDHFAASWDQILYVSKWLSLCFNQISTRKPNPDEMHLSDAEKLSSTSWETCAAQKWISMADMAYGVITGKSPEEFILFGDDLKFQYNWTKLFETILPAFFTMATLEPSARFKAVQELAHDRPSATLPVGENVERPATKWDSSTPRDAVAVLVDRINDLATQGRQLFSTAHGRPGSVSRIVDFQSGDFVARVEGVHFPLVLRRMQTARMSLRFLGTL